MPPEFEDQSHLAALALTHLRELVHAPRAAVPSRAVASHLVCTADALAIFALAAAHPRPGDGAAANALADRVEALTHDTIATVPPGHGVGDCEIGFVSEARRLVERCRAVAAADADRSRHLESAIVALEAYDRRRRAAA